MHSVVIFSFCFLLQTLGQWKVPIDVPEATEKSFLYSYFRDWTSSSS